MRKHNQFLSRQIARFGAMTIPQMEFACSDKCGKATVYRMIDDLLEQGLIKRMPHIGKAGSLFSPRPALYRETYGDEIKTSTGLNEVNILHTIEVTQVLLNLSRYAFVSGIATEYEISSSDLSKFCHSRTPDGIIQITKESGSFELAVEVERTRRSDSRIEDVIEKYKYTLMKDMPCAGLLVVVQDQALFDVYQLKISKLPIEIAERLLVVTHDGLLNLKQEHFGEFGKGPNSSLEKTAKYLQGQIQFVQSFQDTKPSVSPICIGPDRNFLRGLI
jgi:hypothetical protein